jgi:ribosomal protein S18 acetylase RimI-like enzyme
MITADITHKQRVIEMLSACFDNNKTVNYIVKQDEKRSERVKELIDYSFDACVDSGQVYLSDDANAVIICSLSVNKLPILEEALLTVRFVFKVIGFDGISRILKREKYVNSFHPQDEEFIYIWFIGVEKSHQKKGLGSNLLQEVIKISEQKKVPIYIETSVETNVSFYEKYGFQLYHTADEELFGFKLYFLRRLVNTSSDFEI